MEANQITVSEYLWLEYPTYDLLFAGHGGYSAYLCRDIIGSCVRQLTDSVVRASESGAIDPDTPMSRITTDIEEYLFKGYTAPATAGGAS